MVVHYREGKKWNGKGRGGNGNRYGEKKELKTSRKQTNKQIKKTTALNLSVVLLINTIDIDEDAFSDTNVEALLRT